MSWFKDSCVCGMIVCQCEHLDAHEGDCIISSLEKKLKAVTAERDIYRYDSQNFKSDVIAKDLQNKDLRSKLEASEKEKEVHKESRKNLEGWNDNLCDQLKIADRGFGDILKKTQELRAKLEAAERVIRQVYETQGSDMDIVGYRALEFYISKNKEVDS